MNWSTYRKPAFGAICLGIAPLKKLFGVYFPPTFHEHSASQILNTTGKLYICLCNVYTHTHVHICVCMCLCISFICKIIIFYFVKEKQLCPLAAEKMTTMFL